MATRTFDDPSPPKGPLSPVLELGKSCQLYTRNSKDSTFYSNFLVDLAGCEDLKRRLERLNRIRSEQ